MQREARYDQQPCLTQVVAHKEMKSATCELGSNIQEDGELTFALHTEQQPMLTEQYLIHITCLEANTALRVILPYVEM